MILEVGKSYRTRDGGKVVIVSVDGGLGIHYPFNGDNNQTYSQNGRWCCSYESGADLVALCEDNPAAPKYKAGDILTVRLLDEGAKVMNRPNTNDDVLEIIYHIPAPEQKFDWSTVKAGMAFKQDGKIFWYAAEDITDEDYAIFTESKEWVYFVSYLKEDFKRAPEHDIIIKEIK